MKKIMLIITLLAATVVGAVPVRSMVAARNIAMQLDKKEPPYPLPDGVVAVEYLASTNANLARINTGIKMTSTMGFEVKYGSVRETSSYYAAYVCGGLAWSQSVFYLTCSWSNGGQTPGIRIDASSYYSPKIDIKYGNRPLGYLDIHTALADPASGIWVDGEEKFSGAFQSVGSGNRYPYCNLFCQGGESSPTQIKDIDGLNGTVGRNLRIYRFRLFDNGTDIIDLVPVREGGIGKFYDLITRTFYENSGSGTFVVGPDL